MACVSVASRRSLVAAQVQVALELELGLVFSISSSLGEGEGKDVWPAACGASSERLRVSGTFTLFSVGLSVSEWASESRVSSEAPFETHKPATSSSASSTVVLNAVLSRMCASDGGVGPRPTTVRASLLALDVDESERCVENEPELEPLPLALVRVLAAESDADAGDRVNGRGSADADCSCGLQTAAGAQVVLVSADGVNVRGEQLLSLALADDWASAMALVG